MMRAWFAVALLSVSWLWGLDYYRPANGFLWSIAVALGAICLYRTPLRWPGRREAALTIGLLLPVVWWMPWPYRAAPLAIAIGLGLHLLPIPRRWPSGVGQGVLAAGTILLGQAVVLWAYECLTARSHELPWPLPSAIGGVAALLGVDSAADGNTLALQTFREVFRLGATWGLFLDPATLAFFIGGLVILGMAAGALPVAQASSLCSEGQARCLSYWLRAAGTLAALLAVWLPLRVGLLMGLLLHRAIRLDPAARVNLMDQFFSPWVYLALLVPPALAAWRLVGGRREAGGDEGLVINDWGLERDDRRPSSRSPNPIPNPQSPIPVPSAPSPVPRPPPPAPGHPAAKPWRYPTAICLVLAGVAVFAFWFHWQPVGRALDGRVMFVERHSTWSPTMPAYSTTRFGEKGSYNYAAIYDYASESYRMSRLLESDAIDDEKLSTCDVLIIKIPDSPYTPEEVEAVVHFVERGGGLLLIGDHTDYERSSSYMNRITQHFGFKYRHDLLFFTGDPLFQPYTPPAVPHPIVQRVPPMEFAVSCSIDPGTSAGQAVIRGTGLWNLPPEYRASNWHPEPEYRTDMQYGAFIQLWATTYGTGRVLAWTDSTIFSSFCAFQPGKAELLFGAINWLNHRSRFDRPGWRWGLAVAAWLAALGLVGGGWRVGRKKEKGKRKKEEVELAGNASFLPCRFSFFLFPFSFFLLLATILLGWTAGCLAAVAVHRSTFLPPEPTDRKFRVVIDRTVSDVPLGRGAFSEGEEGAGYGLLEQWIARLGYVTQRRSGREVLDGDMVVVICPDKAVSQEFREGLVEYVAGGGKLLVIDSPDNPGSTASSLLWPFGLSVSHDTSRKGQLTMAGNPGTMRSMVADGARPAVEADWAGETQGGTPFMWVDGLAVAARQPYGQGEVMVIGCGSAFDDASLGVTWMLKATPDVQARSQMLFAFVRALATGQPIAPPGESTKSQTPNPKEIPMTKAQ